MIKQSEEDDISRLLHKKDWITLAKFLEALPTESWTGKTYFAKGMLLAFGPASLRNVQGAIAAIEHASILQPENTRLLTILSELYLQSKRLPMAMHAVTLAKMRAQQDPLIGITFGRIAWACGEKDLAYRAFTQVCQQIPADKSSLIPLLKTLTLSLAPFWQQTYKGKRVVLARMTSKHRDFLFSCRKNRDFQHHYHLFQDSSPEGIERDLKEAERSPFETKKISWVIEINDRPIGLASLVGIDFNNSRTEILIGIPDDRTFGIGLEATLLVMEFAFSVIKLSKLFSYVYSDNIQSQENTLHLGFRQEGLLRSHVIDPISKQPLNLFVNGCLSDEFYQNDKLMALANRLLGRIPRQPDNEQIHLSAAAKTPEELILRIASALSHNAHEFSTTG